MAKIQLKKNETKTKKIQNIPLKGCTVKLKRLSNNCIQKYLTNKNITVNIGAQIKGGTLKIGKTTIGSKNKVFDIHLKVHKGGFDIIENQSSSHTQVERPKLTTNEPVNKPCLPFAAKVGSETTTKSLTVLINEGWIKCKRQYKASGISVEIGGLIMAKMATYSPWPARLNGFTSNKKRACVYFFGDGTTGHVNISEITPFNHSMNVIRLLLLRKASKFHKGIAEVEAIMKTPPHLSLLKELNSVQNS